jgi:hypothetical protein
MLLSKGPLARREKSWPITESPATIPVPAAAARSTSTAAKARASRTTWAWGRGGSSRSTPSAPWRCTALTRHHGKGEAAGDQGRPQPRRESPAGAARGRLGREFKALIRDGAFSACDVPTLQIGNRGSLPRLAACARWRGQGGRGFLTGKRKKHSIRPVVVDRDAKEPGGLTAL